MFADLLCDIRLNNCAIRVILFSHFNFQMHNWTQLQKEKNFSYLAKVEFIMFIFTNALFV